MERTEIFTTGAFLEAVEVEINGEKQWRWIVTKFEDESFLDREAIDVYTYANSQDKLFIQEAQGVYWVALRDRNGYQRFGEALQALGIPHQPYNGNLDDDLPEILDGLFNQ